VEQMSDIHPNLGLLSYSSCCLLHTCPRKYQLRKLYNPEEQVRERNVHTDFGSLVGLGLQHYYMSYGNMPLTYVNMLATWTEELNSDEGYKDKKTFFHALLAVDRFIQIYQTRLKDYELFVGDGSGKLGFIAGTELGFSVAFFDHFKYRGFVDILLQHKYTKQFLVIECKTTKYKSVHEAQFKNSAQGLGYSLVIDTISSSLGTQQAASYEVLYLIWSTSSNEWLEIEVKHTHTDRAQWLQLILFDIERIQAYNDAGVFPMHGESCYSYFRACDFYEICTMHDKSLMLDKAKVVEDEEGKFFFNFTLNELIQAQLEKHEME
jgi:hypothetical protein